MASISQFIKELRRRNVFRTGVAYVIVAWLLVQVSDILLATFAAPAWVMRAIVMALAVGFPVVLILAWIYEITAEGVKRTEEVSSGESISAAAGRQVDFVIIGVLVVAVALFAADRFRWIDFGTEPSVDLRSIAVLPFENLGGDPEQEYFVDGMTETLITELSKIAALRVISRQSVMQFKGTKVPLPDIAQQLNVDAVVEGSALLIGGQVRITVQLIEAATDRHLWADNYDRALSDVLALHSEVARTIARKIHIVVTPEETARLADVREVDPEAYMLWLKGNFHLGGLNEASFRRALASYQEAIDRDPDYAPGYAGLAMAYIALGSWHTSVSPHDVMRLAKKAAEQALSLDPAVAEAHLALGRIRAVFDWDWAGADRAFKQGMTLNPSDTAARIEYANFLTFMGRFEESIEIGRQTLELDPLSPTAYNELGWALWFAGSDDEALELYREGLEIDPDFPHSHLILSAFYEKTGDFDRALAHLAHADRVQQTPSPYMGFIGRIYALAGRQTEARSILSQLMERRAREFVPANALAYIYLGLGEYEEALRWLQMAYEEHNVVLIMLKEHWAYDPLRSDPRFKAILDRMDFPEP